MVLFHQLLDDRLIRGRTAPVVLDPQELDFVPLDTSGLVDFGYPGVEPIGYARIVSQLVPTPPTTIGDLLPLLAPDVVGRTHRHADGECS